MSLFTFENSYVLLLLITMMAVLYSSVGHGGASGYLAAMAILGLAPDVMKPAALAMNIFVSALVLLRMNRKYSFNWSLFVPIVLGSVPMAYLGGRLMPDQSGYQAIVGTLLLLAALHMLFRLPIREYTVQAITWQAVVIGLLLGFVAGLTGVGGGIYLSPLLLLLRWTTVRDSIAIAAAFILVNSTAGLLGYLSVSTSVPAGIPLLVICALTGAVLGSELAVRRAPPRMLRQLLGVVLVIAGSKMILAG